MLELDDKLILDCKRLVFSIVNKYCNYSNKEDLYQEGMKGVLKAFKKYDDNQNVKFSSFAYKYILGEILEYIRSDRNIRIGRDLISDYRKIMIAKDHIYKTYGRTSSNYELSKILNMPEDRIVEAINYNEKERSINEVISDDENITLEDIISYDNCDNTDVLMLKDAYENLNEYEKEIIYKRYFQNKTQSELAKEINVSQVKIYRLERKILDKMKDKMT